MRNRLAEIIIATMQANGSAGMLLTQCISVIKTNEPLFANKNDTEIKRRLEGLFSSPVEYRGVTLHLKREIDGKNDKPLMVMS